MRQPLYEAIARDLGIGLRAVELHRGNIAEMPGVRSPPSAVRMAPATGLVPLHSPGGAGRTGARRTTASVSVTMRGMHHAPRG